MFNLPEQERKVDSAVYCSHGSVVIVYCSALVLRFSKHAFSLNGFATLCLGFLFQLKAGSGQYAQCLPPLV